MEGLSREGLSQIARELGLSLVVAFGSRVSGSHRPDSDLDLGVRRADARPMALSELGEVQLALQERLGDFVQVSDLAISDVVFRFEVVGRGVPVFEEPVGAWVEYVADTLIAHAELAPFIRACVEGVGRRAQARVGASP